jgi:hypothetical protein
MADVRPARFASVGYMFRISLIQYCDNTGACPLSAGSAPAVYHLPFLVQTNSYCITDTLSNTNQ